MPGDDLVPEPLLSLTHAIDIGAPPERVWPWLVQMGAGRAGWYSYDRIDNGGHQSSDRIVPEYQRLAVGDVMPAVPGAGDAFMVASLEPRRSLVLDVPAAGGGSFASWGFRLEATAGGGSRLSARGRLGPLALRGPAGEPPERPALGERLHRAISRLPGPLLRLTGTIGHWVMASRQLRGIKRRAERDAAAGRRGVPGGPGVSGSRGGRAGPSEARSGPRTPAPPRHGP